MTRTRSGNQDDIQRRVLIIEDEGLLRTMLSDVLIGAGFEVLAVADAAGAAREFDDFDPDAVLSDIDLGSGVSGLELIASLTKRAPYLGVVILSNYEVTPDYRQRWLGQARYLRKSDVTDTATVLAALEAVLTGSVDGAGVAAADAADLLAGLTSTQVQVLRMVAEGLSNGEIAERRGSTVGAVEHVLNRTFAALGLQADPSRNLRVAAARIYLEGAGRPGARTSR